VSRARVANLLQRERRSTGFALVVASHDPAPAGCGAQRELRLVDGRL
jgi:predicted ABC-type transport system involved in lysophospholipase L1 biosynthesis ATPase subunit